MQNSNNSVLNLIPHHGEYKSEEKFSKLGNPSCDCPQDKAEKRFNSKF